MGLYIYLGWPHFLDFPMKAPNLKNGENEVNVSVLNGYRLNVKPDLKSSPVFDEERCYILNQFVCNSR